MQVVDPGDPPRFVTEPAAQTAQGTVDVPLYWPAGHAVQFTPPLAKSVSVTEPGGHSLHWSV